MTSREQLIFAINAAELAGFYNFATALRTIYHREYPNG